MIVDRNESMQQEKMLKLREELLDVEEARLHGAQDCSLDEVIAMMNESIHEARRAGA